MKINLLAGNLPYLVLVPLCASAFLVGMAMRKDIPLPKIAVAEKGAVVLEAVLSRPGMSRQQIQLEVQQPIIDLLKKYEQQGYFVIDATKDDQGYMSVAAVPSSSIDITNELRRLVNPDMAKLKDKEVNQ